MSGVGDHGLAAAYERALALEKAGRRDAAVAAWREVLALDPTDHGGAAVRLAALGADAPPEGGASEAYVRTLFDQHAEAFDEVLVRRLGYGVPDLVRQALLETPPGRWRRLLDLGCGTGLAGAAISAMAEHATGLDLSEEMLALSDARGVYDALYVGDATGFLLAEDEDQADDDGNEGDDRDPWDLIVAADMVPYLGRLEPLFDAVAARIAPGGVWCFSTETLPAEMMAGRDLMVGPTHRFAHAPDYLTRALEGAGFGCERLDPIVVRFEEGRPVAGHLAVARRG